MFGMCEKMTLNFSNIRAIDNSQNDGFEEFCCQLFYFEKNNLNIPNESIFFRLRGSGGDGGIEAYWKLPNEDEIGIQAKYFLSAKDIDWAQVDKSVKKTLNTHPKIKKYIICFGCDLTDSRKKTKSNKEVESQQNKYDKWVTDWKKEANKKNIAIEFEFWGQSKLIEIISRSNPEYEGRKFFWFREQELSQKFLTDYFEKVKADLGKRYRPEINIKQNHFDYFDYLGQTEYVFNEINILKNDLMDKRFNLSSLESAELITCSQKSKIIPAYNKLKEYLLIHFEKTEPNQFSKIDFKKILDLAEELETNLIAINEHLNEIFPNANEKDKKKIEDHFSSLRYFRRPLDNIIEFASDKRRTLINTNKTLFVNGEGGEGKTHLFAETTRERLSKELTSILFIGEHINQNENITKQLINELGLNCTSEEFLGALDSKAQMSGFRGIIAIDAINESDDPSIWTKRIAGFIKDITKYPHLAVAISYRTIYQDKIFKEDYIKKNKDIILTAPGFRQNTETAICEIFSHFGIERPAVPNMMPEFYNPLFLITFCESLQRDDLTKIPDGINGLMDVFNYYLKSLNKEISEKLDLDPSDKIIQKCCYEIANYMAKNNDEFIEKSELKKILEPFDNSKEYKKTLLFQFLSTGLMYKIKPYKSEEEEFKFTFQRFSDYIIVKSLLEKYLNVKSPVKSFYKNKPLGKIFKEDLNPGWLEALAINLPEYSEENIEILDIFKNEMTDYYTRSRVLSSFEESLLWRNPKNITKKTFQYIVSNFNDKTIYEIFINLSIKKDCKINAYWIDKHLKKFTLIENDMRWTQAIQEIYRYGNNNIIDKIITWAWQTDTKNLDDETAKLYATILSWFFSSSNRKLRDCATRGLVNLFTSKLSIISDILINFKDVNDSYIIERLYCSAYGAMLIKRNILTERTHIKKIIETTYNLIFANDNPPINILIRDYAKGIIEIGEAQDILDDFIDLNKIKPPYKSVFPSRIPSKNSLEKKYKPYQDITHPFLQRVYSSVIADDFERYILQPNINHIIKFKTPSFNAENLWEKFVAELSNLKQKKALSLSLHSLKYQLNPSLSLFQIKIFGEDGEEDLIIQPPKIEEDSQSKLFYKSLSAKEKITLDEILEHYSNEEKLSREVYSQNSNFHVDLKNKAQRWILKRILELCDYKNLPKDFKDETFESYNRHEHRTERIGKKYQWIAMYEFLALALDKYEFCDSYWVYDKYVKYDGAWHFYIRNIDPTLTNKILSSDTMGKPFWITESYNQKLSIQDSRDSLKSWCKDCTNIPNPKKLIDFKYKGDNFLNLKSFFDWYTQINKENPGARDILSFFYSLNSYIIKNEDMPKAIRKLKKNNIRNYRMPYDNQNTHIFSGEYPDSIACKDNFINYNKWEKIEEFNFQIKNTSASFLCEYEYDYSMDGNSFSFYVPEKWLIDEMKLKHSGEDSIFVNDDNNPIFFDPGLSTQFKGKSALLVKKDEFLRFLDENNYSVFWTMTGEKLISGYRVELSGIFWYKDGELEGQLYPYECIEN